MPVGYSQTPTLLRGALIQFSAPMLVPIPNIIVFQYNPETMTRTLTPWSPSEAGHDYSAGSSGGLSLSAEQINQLAQPYDPQESFSLVLELDATDDLETPELHPIAVVAGIADRIAALEMLCYPPDPDSSLGSATASVAVSAAGSALGGSSTADTLNNLAVPIVLFFWGPGRIVPVRVKSLSVEEQQYSPTLFPVRAKVTIQLTVLDEKQLVNVAGLKGPNSAAVEIAKACYNFTKAQKKALALANIANSADSIMSMLPI